MKVGIGGAEENKWLERQKVAAKKKIKEIFFESVHESHDRILKEGYRPKYTITLVSGHCHLEGVDIWAEEIADSLGVPKEIYPAPAMDWNDKLRCLACGTLNKLSTIRCQDGFCPGDLFERVDGYRTRNIRAAEACDVWYDIEPWQSCRHCGGSGYNPIPMHHRESSSIIFRYEMCRYCEGDGAYSGATWTKKQVEKLGKVTYKYIIR